MHPVDPLVMRRSTTLVVALAACLISLITPLSVRTAHAEPTSESQFLPVTPAVLLDTRSGAGTDSAGQIPANGSVTFQVAGRGGVPASGASAVVLNITELDTTAFGWFTVYPSDQPTTTSTLTFHKGENATGEDFTRLTSTGKVTIANHSDSPVHIAVGIRGYFLEAANTQVGNKYYPVPTQYLYDTRPALATGSPAKNTPLDANSSMTFEVAGQKDIPTTGTSAVAVNVVATGQTQKGWLTMYPSDQPDPGVTTVDYVPGETDSSFTVTPLTSTGKLTITNHGNSAVHISVTLRGYFQGTSGADGAQYMTTPTKVIIDTVSGTGVEDGATTPVPAGASISLDATAASGLDAERIAAAALNINARRPTGQGWLSVYPTGGDDPRISSVNFDEVGESTNGFDTVVPSPNGVITITNHSPGTVHVQVSARGYFLRSVPTEELPPTPSLTDMTGLADDAPDTPPADGVDYISTSDVDARDADDVWNAASTHKPVRALFQPESNGGVSTQGLPSGCGLYVLVYKIDYVAKGSAKTSCLAPMNVLYNRTDFYRKRWYGWQWLDDDTSTTYNSRSVASISRKGCYKTGRYTYKVIGRGEVTRAGTRYTAQAYDTDRFNC